jgi:hypothetical protein
MSTQGQKYAKIRKKRPLIMALREGSFGMLRLSIDLCKTLAKTLMLYENRNRLKQGKPYKQRISLFFIQKHLSCFLVFACALRHNFLVGATCKNHSYTSL